MNRGKINHISICLVVSTAFQCEFSPLDDRSQSADDLGFDTVCKLLYEPASNVLEFASFFFHIVSRIVSLINTIAIQDLGTRLNQIDSSGLKLNGRRHPPSHLPGF